MNHLYKVYNFRVANNHTYFVGENPILVHNMYDSGYYKKGLKEIPDDWIEIESYTDKIKSETFKDFLKENGYNPKNWYKVMERWADHGSNIYQRHYWTDGKNFYYHGEGIEEFFPH